MSRQVILKSGKRNLLVTVTAALAMLFSMVIGPGASAEPIGKQPQKAQFCANLVEDISAEQEELLNKIVSIGSYFYMEGDDLAISLTEQELTEQFDFTAEDYSFLQTDVLDVANGMARPSSSSMSGLVGPQANCSGWYISNWDLTAGVAATLVTAADIGPVALAAAFTKYAKPFCTVRRVIEPNTV